MQIRIILEFFEKYWCPGVAFFLRSSRDVSNEQLCLKTTGLCEGCLLLSTLHHFFYLTFSAPISRFPISSSLLFFFFLMFFLMSLSSIVEKLLYTYVNNMYNICILEHMTFCLTKKFMTFWFHLFDLVLIGCKISNLKIISKITYGVCITESQKKKLYFLKFSESPSDCKEIQPVHS